MIASGVNDARPLSATPRRAYRELRRLATQYGKAIAVESNGDARRMLPCARDVVLARLRYGVGPRYFSLFGLGQRPRATWREFVTDDPAFKRFLADMSPPAAHAVADDKALFHLHCREHRLPAVPIVCLVARAGARRHPPIAHAEHAADLATAIAGAPRALFVKPLDGTFGEDAFALDRDGERLRYAGRTGTATDLYAHLAGPGAGHAAWLVQPRIAPHARLRAMNGTDALATVRIVTCMRDGRPEPLYALLKVPVGDNRTDNFHHGATGNLVASIDLADGSLAAARGSSRRDWPVPVEHARHPATGERIAGERLPHWRDAVALVLRAQASLPDLRSTGWDVALTDDGALLVETNARYSVDILQVAQGRGLRSELCGRLGAAQPGAGA